MSLKSKIQLLVSAVADKINELRSWLDEGLSNHETRITALEGAATPQEPISVVWNTGDPLTFSLPKAPSQVDINGKTLAKWEEDEITSREWSLSGTDVTLLVQLSNEDVVQFHFSGAESIQLEIGKNKFDKTDPLNGLGVIRNDNTTGTNTAYSKTGYIKVSSGQRIVLSHSGSLTPRGMRFIAAYDSSKEVLSDLGVSSEVLYYDVPEGVNFIRICYSTSPIDTVQVEVASTPTEYSPFEKKLSPTILKDGSIGYEKLADEIKYIAETDGENTLLTNLLPGDFGYEPAQFLGYGNKYNFDSATSFNAVEVQPYDEVNDISLVVLQDGNEIHTIPLSVEKWNSLVGYSAVLLLGQYIALEANTDYIIGYRSSSEFGYYATESGSENVIAGRYRLSSAGTWDFTFSGDAKNVMLNPVQSTGERQQAIKTIISDGSIPESKLSIDAKKKLNDHLEPPKILLPPKIFVAVGRTIELYNKQVVLTNNIHNYSIQWSGLGKSMSRKWTYSGHSDNIGESELTIRVYNKDMVLLVEKNTTVVVASNVINTPFKVCPIGASYVSGKPWLQEIIDLSSDQITFEGTRYTGTTPGSTTTHEGRPGAQAITYLSEMNFTYNTDQEIGDDGKAATGNPFWNPDTDEFDMNYYRSNYNKNPDRILTLLGSNYVFSATSAPANTKKLIDNIRTTDPDIPIYVCFSLMRGSQDGLSKQTSNEGFTANPELKYESDIKAFEMYQGLIDVLEDEPNVHIVALAQMHDNDYNFGEVEEPVNPRATQTEIFPSEAVHPSDQGYMQFADVIFSALACT